MGTMNTKQNKQIRDFFRQYVNPRFKTDLNVVKLSKANTLQHNIKLACVCCVLLKNNVPFYTEVRLKNGLRPDIVCPTLSSPILEVLHTETEEDFKKNKSEIYAKDNLGVQLFKTGEKTRISV